MSGLRYLLVPMVFLALLFASCNAQPGASSQATSSSEPTDVGEPTDEPTTEEPTDTLSPIPDDSSNPPTSAAAEVDLARLATGETPQGWVEDLSNDGACRDAVPADWTRGVIQGIASTNYVQVILANDAVTDFKAEVAHLKATYFGELNDSANEVLIEDDHVFVMRETVRGGASYVIALNGETTACGLIIQVDEVGADQYRDTSTQLLYTLAEAK